MNPEYTDLIIVLDRSGSMSSTRVDAEGGFNAFINEQKKIAGKCLVSLYQFDDKYEAVYESLSIHEVPNLILLPRGSTALLDAVGKTIVSTGERLNKMSEADRPGKVIFMIITDGAENASREFVFAEVKALIEEQQTKYNWQFVFIGSDLNTFNTAQDLGIKLTGVMQYNATGSGTASMYAATTRSVSNYRTGQSDSLDMNQS